MNQTPLIFIWGNTSKSCKLNSHWAPCPAFIVAQTSLLDYTYRVNQLTTWAGKLSEALLMFFVVMIPHLVLSSWALQTVFDHSIASRIYIHIHLTFICCVICKQVFRGWGWACGEYKTTWCSHYKGIKLLQRTCLFFMTQWLIVQYYVRGN